MASLPQQTQFGFYNDDGSDTASTAKAAQNTNISVDPAGGNLLLQLRVGIQETGGTGTGANQWRLRCSKNGGAYAVISTTAADVKAGTSPNLTNGTSITAARLAGFSGVFFAGEVVNAAAVTLNTKNLQANNYDEFVWCLQVLAAGVALGDTYDFEVQFASADLAGGYTKIPRISIASAAGRTATASGSLLLHGSATAAAKVNAAAAGTINFAGSGTGAVKDTAHAAGIFSLAGSAAGKVALTAQATSSLGLAGTATGDVTVKGQASGALPLTGAASGSVGPNVDDAVARGSLQIGGAAAGNVTVSGSANDNLAMVGAATAVVASILVVPQERVRTTGRSSRSGATPVSNRIRQVQRAGRSQ